MGKKTKKFGLLRIGNFDMPLLIILLILLGIGLVCLFSASHVYASYYDGNSYHYILRQGIFAAAGLVAMYLISLVDYKVWRKLAVWLYGAAILLLGIALIAPSQNGVHRWIGLGSITFQPSDFAKFALIVFLAQVISVNYNKMKEFSMFIKLMCIIGVICGLVVIEPHLSGTMLIAGIGLVMLFVGGTPLIFLGGLVVLAGCVVLVMVFGVGYEADRISVWLDPLGVFAADRDMAWQTVQSLYAIGSGGLMGLGIGNSRQKHLFLPEPQNDFIFAIICEELGLIGAILIIALFAALVWRGVVIATRAPDKFGALLAVGISAQIGIQVLLNIAVVTNTIPNTGIGLPFFSYGGTSMMMLLGEMGVLFSIARQMKQKN
ncbi:MAG: putative lipid II flippase FtsW [Clostridia bacterium]|nr:putative lipid II flippase FtsW [Clostridia bacterium]